jgi:alpha-glucosidase
MFHKSVSKAFEALESFQFSDQQAIGQSNQLSFKVRFYSQTVVQITCTRESSFEDFSYSVVAQPERLEILKQENPQTITLRSDQLVLEIQRNPVRFRFLTTQDQVINEDDPGLGTAWLGEHVTSYKKLQKEERFIGLGEKTGNLDRRGSSYVHWNTDAYGYHAGQDPLYCSTPFYIGLHQGLCYGIFFDNTHKTFFNFGASNNRFSSFAADAGEMNYYFIYGTTVADIIRQYTWLTGRMEMPPLWSIGYQQCRYSYYPDKEVINLARTFREKDIPADVIVMDIHYMEKYKIFTWDQKHFPEPQKLLNEVKDMGFDVVLMCDPGIKEEKGYDAYEDGVKQDVFIKYPDGEHYSGQVWPGWCHFPDFTKPAARAWWKEKLKSYTDLGVKGYWNDMNEIATWGHALPENLVFDFEGNQSTARRGRNVFGFQMARATYEGTKELLKGQRPFNLTRSGFSGVQRYAAVWTGDNVSYDEHMLLGVRLVNSLGLTGIAFAGYDVGGFVGDANTKLFARWISIGALSPFFRGHTMINTRDAEPWSFGEEVEQISRNYIKFRYQLLPYIYSLFHDAAKTGMPVQRSLAIDYPTDSRVFDGTYQNQYFFGPHILVAPVESTKDLVKVFLPRGEWYSLYTGQKYSGDQEIIIDCPIHRLPVFIRAGGVLPMQNAISHTKQKTDTLKLHIYAGNDSTSFEFYEDDGATFDYQKGACSTRLIESNGTEVILRKISGSYASSFKTLELSFHGLNTTNVTINGQPFTLKNLTHSFFTPLEKYDPIHDPESMGEENIHRVTIPYTAETIHIRW